MNRYLIRASQRLSERRIIIMTDGYEIEVFWFRVMHKTGDWFIRRHAHSTYEFHFCVRGMCIVDTDTSSFIIKEGYFYLSAPGVYHAQRPANKDEFIEYSLNINIIPRQETAKYSLGRELAGLFSVLEKSPCIPVADHFGALALFNQALDEAEQRRLGFEWILHSLVQQILVAASRGIELELTPFVKSSALPEQNYRINMIEEYILANIHKDISPGDIAEYMNLSEKQISRIVFAHKGFPTKKLITRTKLNKAKELLVSGDRPIKEIASGLGFSSEYYFSSVFKLHVGCPPGLFRTSMIQKTEDIK